VQQVVMSQPGVVMAQPGMVMSPQYRTGVLVPQPIMMVPSVAPLPAQDPLIPLGSLCNVCNVALQGPCYRCFNCTRNGRTFNLCTACHSNLRPRPKSMLDDVKLEFGALQYNYSHQRPHEEWHTHERAQAPVAIPSAAVQAFFPKVQVQLSVGCSNLPRGGFGMISPDPQVVVRSNSQEILTTEMLRDNCNPEFSRAVRVWNENAVMQFVVYSGGAQVGCVTAHLSEILSTPDRRWVKSLEDPMTGYRLTSGVMIVRWAPVQNLVAMGGAMPSTPVMAATAAVPYASPPVAAQALVTSSEWNCGSCTYLNPPTRATCAMCNSPM